MFGVALVLVLVGLLLWRRSASARHWKHEAALWNGMSGCQMTADEYRAWMERSGQ